MRTVRWLRPALAGALACLLLACFGPPPPETFTSEHFSGGVKVFSWSGTVRGKFQILFWPSGVDYRKYGSSDVQGRGRVHEYLPQTGGICYLDVKEKPRRLKIEQQPTRHNGFVCRVLIRHELSTPGRYSFDMYFLPTARD